MKIPRSLIGKYVELIWRDPRDDRVCCRPTELLRGFAALATWKERGVIDDLTDGIVRIIHSEGTEPQSPGGEESKPDYRVTWVHEALVESIVVMEPAKESIPISVSAPPSSGA